MEKAKQKEELDRLSAERHEKLLEEGIPKIRARYEQLVKLRQQQPKADDGGKPPSDSAKCVVQHQRRQSVILGSIAFPYVNCKGILFITNNQCMEKLY